MSAVHQALENLTHVVRTLEGSVEQLEANLAGQQRDMFVAEQVGKLPNSGEIAETIDRLIENAEKVLSDDASQNAKQQAEGIHG